MSAALKRPMTLDEFLAWEERQEFKHEFDGIVPIAMVGGTIGHGAIQRNLAIAIGGRLRGKPCQFLGSDVKVEIHGKIRYPDGIVLCTPLDRRATRTAEPVVVFEVLSPSTADIDRIDKNRDYQSLASVRRYVMVEQDRMAATVFAREGDDWIGHLFVGEATLAMPEIGVTVPLAEFYIDVDLTDGADRAPDADGTSAR